MTNIFQFTAFIVFFNCFDAELIIKKVEMRNLKPKDIALIFDMTVYNDPKVKKEPLDFRVRCEKCCLNLPGNSTSCEVTKLIGGNFGSMRPGSTKVVSLLWPTVTLYNRIGSCNITLTSYNTTGAKVRTSQLINFDTTINKQMIADSLKGVIKSFNLTDCPTPDLNPLFNCSPVDCEEKYFGQRSFFNTKTNFCEPVPDCSRIDSEELIYDYTVNECVDLKRIICKEHIIAMKKGEYDNNVWEPQHNVEAFANITHMPIEVFETSKKTVDSIDLDSESPWKGILQGFMIIVGALILYICISCCAFCLMVVITKRASRSHKRI